MDSGLLQMRACCSVLDGPGKLENFEMENSIIFFMMWYVKILDSRDFIRMKSEGG